MNHDQPTCRRAGKKADSIVQGGVERVVQAAIRSWPTTFRLCLIVSVVAATLAIVVCFIGPSALLVFMK